MTDTSMMFMTPMPPTRRLMPAMPLSRMVSVRSTEVAVEMSDCDEVMVKSASATEVMPWRAESSWSASW